MKKNIKLAIFSSFVIVYLFVKFHSYIETTYLISFFSENILALFVALMFINAVSLSIVLLESNEAISSSIDSPLAKTTKQIILSINKQMHLIGKQIVLMVISILFLMFFDLMFLQNHQEYLWFINLSIVLFFIYEITILYDTVKSVIVVR